VDAHQAHFSERAAGNSDGQILLADFNSGAVAEK
jgi:hypothetical protein